MIMKDPKEPSILVFVANEDIPDSDFKVRLGLTATLELKHDLSELTTNNKFLETVDRKLSHIFTILHLYLDGEEDSIQRIERVQQEVYDQTWAEIVSHTQRNEPKD